MAKMSTLMLTTAAVLAVFFQMSSADVTCFQCSSATNGDNCGESTFKKDGISTCTGAQCFKTVSSVSAVVASSTVVTRGCYAAVIDSSNKCTSAGGSVAGIGASGTTCYCTSDNCNTAAGIYPSRATGLMALAVALIMAYFSRRLL